MPTIDDYLARLSPPQKAALERIRAIVHHMVPDAQEVISYGMPGFKYQGKYLLGFWAFKDHLSLFPTAGPIEALKDKLANFVTAKGTIQFSLEHPLSKELITEIINVRLAAIRQP